MQSLKTRDSTLYLSDCLDGMREMESNSIDSIVTDPPYGLKFMGKGWDHGIPGVPYWSEALRVAKPGAFLLAFGGTRTFHRLACAIEDAGWELRDSIGLPHESGEWGDCPWVMAWTYGSGFPKSLDVSKAIGKAAGVERKVVGKSQWSQPAKSGHDGGLTGDNIQRTPEGGRFTPDITAPATPEAKLWEGWGTALKPAWEPIIVARKPIKGTVAENVLKWGTGGINVDGCRVEHDEDLSIERAGKTLDTRDQGWGFKGVSRGNQGRFPANLIHDGSDEVMELFPNTKSGEMNSVAKARQYNTYGKMYKRRVTNPASEGSAARFFYCAKASKSEREAGCEDLEKRFVRRDDGQPFGMNTNQYRPDGSERKPIPPRHNNHPTVKPIALMRYLCRLVTPPGGAILDPFMGSGSTGVAAELEGFRFIGIDQDKEAFDIACGRMAGGKEEKTCTMTV